MRPAMADKPARKRAEVMAQFSIGDDIYVIEPQRYIPECTCIVGPIRSIEGDDCVIAASVGRLPENGGCTEQELQIPVKSIAPRIGTPLSKISGRPGQPGYGEFVRIAKSWGYD